MESTHCNTICDEEIATNLAQLLLQFVGIETSVTEKTH